MFSPIQDEISRGIVNSLRLSLGRGRRRYETSTEAYDLYLRGRALPIQGGLTGYDASIPVLEQAIAKDPSFAPAYAGLAAAHASRSGEFRFDLGDEMVKMRAAAEKAIQLDPLLAEAHDALGMSYAREARWQESEKSFRRSIELDPGSSEPRENFATFLLWPLGRLDEAAKQIRMAEQSDPLSVIIHVGMFNILIAGGRYDEAMVECEKLPEGKGRSECLGRVRLDQGKVEQAIQIFTADLNRGLSAGNQVRGYLGFAYARAGRREEAENLEAETPAVNPLNHALIFAGLGDKDRTFEALEHECRGRPFSNRQSAYLARAVIASRRSAPEGPSQESWIAGVARCGRCTSGCCNRGVQRFFRPEGAKPQKTGGAPNTQIARRGRRWEKGANPHRGVSGIPHWNSALSRSVLSDRHGSQRGVAATAIVLAATRSRCVGPGRCLEKYHGPVFRRFAPYRVKPVETITGDRKQRRLTTMPTLLMLVIALTVSAPAPTPTLTPAATTTPTASATNNCWCQTMPMKDWGK